MPTLKQYILLILSGLLIITFLILPPDTNTSPGIKAEDPPPQIPEPPPVTRETRVLMPGTIMETTLHIITAPEEGPTVMFIGGVHGDEIAGWMAAEKLTGWSVDRGKLLVLPRANAFAVTTNTHYYPGMDNLNVSFPGSANGNVTQRLAAAIYAVMEEFKPQWVVDFHEALEFDRIKEGELGQTLIYPWEGSSMEVIDRIIDGLNENIEEELYRYRVQRGGIKGGTIYASRLLGLESFTIETTRKLPLERRISEHLQAARLLLEILEIDVIAEEPEAGTAGNS